MKYFLTAFLIIVSLMACCQTPRVLHYSETGEYDHGTREKSLAMFQGLARGHGAKVVDDQTGDEFNSLSNLNGYDLVVFSNTSGSFILNATQRLNFEDYIKEGGSFLGIHGASDTYRHSSVSRVGNWDWYSETLTGCSALASHAHNDLQDTIFQKGNLNLKTLPAPWVKRDSYYTWENGYVNKTDFHEVLRAANSGMVAHVRVLPYGGKSFYTSLGHSKSNFQKGTMFIELMDLALGYLLDTPFGTSFQPDPPTPEDLGIEIYLKNNILHIKVPENLRPYRLNVFNMVGQKIKIGEDYDISIYPDGIYIIKITLPSGESVYKKVVKK